MKKPSAILENIEKMQPLMIDGKEWGIVLRDNCYQLLIAGECMWYMDAKFLPKNKDLVGGHRVNFFQALRNSVGTSQVDDIERQKLREQVHSYFPGIREIEITKTIKNIGGRVNTVLSGLMQRQQDIYVSDTKLQDLIESLDFSDFHRLSDTSELTDDKITRRIQRFSPSNKNTFYPVVSAFAILKNHGRAMPDILSSSNGDVLMLRILWDEWDNIFETNIVEK